MILRYIYFPFRNLCCIHFAVSCGLPNHVFKQCRLERPVDANTNTVARQLISLFTDLDSLRFSQCSLCCFQNLKCELKVQSLRHQIILHSLIIQVIIISQIAGLVLVTCLVVLLCCIDDIMPYRYLWKLEIE